VRIRALDLPGFQAPSAEEALYCPRRDAPAFPGILSFGPRTVHSGAVYQRQPETGFRRSLFSRACADALGVRAAVGWVGRSRKTRGTKAWRALAAGVTV
jgi:hypothetical protein